MNSALKSARRSTTAATTATAVINASAYGVFSAALENPNITTVYGAAHGIKGVLDDQLYVIDQEDPAELALLPYTPSSAMGSVRYKLKDPEADDTDYKRILEIFKKYNVRYFFYNGGNDSMDTCSKVSRYMKSVGYDCNVIGVPKTIDNDLYGTDHCPGFGSAAKYIATTCMEVSLDAKVYDTGMICIIEIMGRNAGWLAGAAALASASGEGPDLIYLPEVQFDIDDFIKRIKALAKTKKSVVVAVSEGLRTADGKFVCELGAVNDHVDAFGHKQLAGTAAYLASRVYNETGLKSRYIEFSSLQRCAAHLASRCDSDEAYNVGYLAAKAAFEGNTGKMITIEVQCREPYVETYDMFDVHEVANVERKVPLNWIINDGTYVSDEYLKYARPFIIGRVAPYTAGGLPIHMTMSKKRNHK